MKEWWAALSPRGLRVQILLWTILPVTLLLIAFSLTGVRSHQRSMRGLVADRNVALAQVLSSDLSTLLNRYTSGLTILADALPSSGASSRPTILTQASRRLDGMTMLLTEGVTEVVTGPEEPPSWTREVLNRLQGLDPITDAPSFVVTGGEHILAWRFSLEDGANWLVGALPVSNLPFQDVLHTEGLSTGGSVILADRDGHVLFDSDTSVAGDSPAGGFAVAQAFAGESGVQFAPGPQGEEVIAYAPVEGPGWVLVVHEPWEQLTAPLLRLDRAMPFVLVTAAATSLLTLVFGLRYVAQPLQKLRAQADRIGGGDFEAADEPLGAVYEIEELRRTLDSMAHQVQRYQNALQTYLNALTQAQEEERARLARELHDETVQTLIALNHRAQMVKRALARNPKRAEARLAELHAMIGEAIEEVRRFSRALRPLYLEELGLVPALETLAREAGATFAVTGTSQRLPSEKELALYRVAQEALSNARRHAAAQHIGVDLAFNQAGVTLQVRDDGVGFAVPDRFTDLARHGHFGLLGMHERAQSAGGRLIVASSVGQGTRVEARLPDGA